VLTTDAVLCIVILTAGCICQVVTSCYKSALRIRSQLSWLPSWRIRGFIAASGKLAMSGVGIAKLVTYVKRP
jgi:hypothetical protein